MRGGELVAAAAVGASATAERYGAQNANIAAAYLAILYAACFVLHILLVLWQKLHRMSHAFYNKVCIKHFFIMSLLFRLCPIL